MIDLVRYKIKDASEKDLIRHFNRCNEDFLERLNQRVDLLSYCKKLNEDSITFEAWNESDLVGVISVYLNNNESAVGFVSNVSVIKTFERRGIASQLIIMGKEHAQKLGFLELCLNVSSQNKNAQNFYLKHGFNAIASEEEEISMCCKI